MSRKDYIAIANILKDLKNDDLIFSFDISDEDFSALTRRFAITFKIDNVKFDTEKFFNYIDSDKRYKDFTDK